MKSDKNMEMCTKRLNAFIEKLKMQKLCVIRKTKMQKARK